MARILIIDDDTLFRDMLSSAMMLEGHTVRGVGTLAGCRKALTEEAFDLVFLDVGLPDGDGLEIIPVIRQDMDAPDIIIITGDGDADGAEIAIGSGALDYISKPASLTAMKQAVSRALTYRRGISRLEEPERSGIVGHGTAMQQCFRVLAEAASCDAPVLITGETGTGKELFARAIHENSARRLGPFIPVDCGTIANSLTESELFGHEKGAFTGASKSREGLVLQAHGGTLFLDEVGELSMPQQRAFLRVLQEQRFRPVGASRELHSNFRLVAATNRSLEDMVGRGTFRKDLLYRLQAIHLCLPPLRDRGEDIAELTEHCVSRGCLRYGFAPKSLNEAFVAELATYPWPGNVRELLYVVEQALVRARYAPELLPEHLPSSIRVAAARSRMRSVGGVEPGEGAASEAKGERRVSAERRAQESDTLFPSAFFPNLSSEAARGGESEEGDALARTGGPRESSFPQWKVYKDAALLRVEKSYLQHLLHVARGNVPLASRMAGVSRQWLYAMLRRHGISREWAVGLHDGTRAAPDDSEGASSAERQRAAGAEGLTGATPTSPPGDDWGDPSCGDTTDDTL